MMKVNLQKKNAEKLLRKARRDALDLSLKWGILVTLLLAASVLATL